jgi:cytochrome c biogenesis protein CcmG/thiol:disulfide interchange protein DsbE
MSTVAPPAATGARRPPKRRLAHPARWISGAVLAVLVAVAIVAATRPSYQATQAASPLDGKAAPAIRATTLDGTSVDLASYRGHFVYVNFFASWCAPCQAEAPNLVAFNFQQSRLDGGAKLLSVVFDDADSSARAFTATYGTEWPAATDPGGSIANSYGVTSPPSTFLVDPRGVVVANLVGPVTERQLDNLLAQARAGQASNAN